MGALRLGQGARRHGRGARHRGAGRHRAALRLSPLSGFRGDRRHPHHARPDPRRSRPPGAPASRPQQQRQAGPGRHPRDRIPGPGVSVDPGRPRRQPARTLHPRHPGRVGRQTIAAGRDRHCPAGRLHLPAQPGTPPAIPRRCPDPHPAGRRGRARPAGRHDGFAGHRRYVASQFDAIFSDKVQGGEDDVQLQSSGSEADIDNLAAIEARLANLHFDEPGAGARRLMATWQAPRLQSLPEASRTRLLALLNAALPLIARVVADAGVGKHSATLARLLDFFEAIARRSAYLSLLTEYPHTLERVIRMMNASGWAATFLSQHPILLDEMLDDRVRGGAPDCPALAAELSAQLAGAEGDTERQMDLLRDFHHAQLFRLLAQDLAGSLSVERLADYLSALADLIVEAVVGAAWRTVATRHRDTPRFAVIAYGKLGGKELGYVSDLDVIFLFDDEDQDAPANYAKLAQRFITWMTAHTSAGILFDIDTALRPDGASGMLVSSVAAFERYQASSAWVWEHQALTRARFCAGDAATGARFEAIREQVLRRERDGDTLREEVLKMRQRMHAAQTPGAGFDLKQDAGGMIDIEFMVQYLVLRHAHDYPQLTANSGNIALLKTCGELKLIDPAQAGAVADAYRAMRKLQHQVRLQGQDNARVEPALVAKHAEAVRALWLGLFSG